MTDRERLIETLLHFTDNYLIASEDKHFTLDTKVGDVADHLLANGVIVPPCKVGDIVYYIHETFYDNEYMKAKEDEIDFSHIIKIVERPNCKTNLMLEKAQFDWSLMDSWLKGDVFLTKEEAERELEKRGKENER